MLHLYIWLTRIVTNIDMKYTLWYKSSNLMRDYWLKLWVTKGSYFSKGFPSMKRRKSQPASQPSCASQCNGKEEPFAYSDMDYDLLLRAYRLILSALCAQWNTSLGLPLEYLALYPFRIYEGKFFFKLFITLLL